MPVQRKDGPPMATKVSVPTLNAKRRPLGVRWFAGFRLTHLKFEALAGGVYA
jgi:hypothetical protein